MNWNSIFGLFGVTISIDIGTHILKPQRMKRIPPYYPIKKISVIVPVHRESKEDIKATIESFYTERYPLKNIIVCCDREGTVAKETVTELMNRYDNLYYCECPNKSKATKINYAIAKLHNSLGDFIYIRDCQARGEIDCIERMVSCFSDDNVAAVTSHGRVSIPKNFLSRSYAYGKSWINEIGKFRKSAQEKRGAMFVVCGASTMFRKEIMMKYPVPSGAKTEDTHYTFILQNKGYAIRVAGDAMISAPEIDGKGLKPFKDQMRQSYRWCTGNAQCMFIEWKDLQKNKKLLFTTILPGAAEAIVYSVGLLLVPFLAFTAPSYAVGFLIGDTAASLIGTLILIPEKFFKTVFHYPQIMLFKYVNAAIFIYSTIQVAWQGFTGKSYQWSNEWISPKVR